jgi:hypothetical protein
VTRIIKCRNYEFGVILADKYKHILDILRSSARNGMINGHVLQQI